MNIDLSQKNALVCGASKGIGKAIAHQLAVMGASVTILARSQEALKEVLNSLDRDKGQTHDMIVADLSDRDGLQKLISSMTKLRNYHILINNTGGPKGGSIYEARASEFEDAFGKHVLCNQLLAQLLVPGMREEGYGRIVNILSTSVRIPIPGLGVSNTIRGAVASWAKTLANEIAKDGITVNNILPGFTATGRLDQIISSKAEKQNSDQELIAETMMGKVPMGRFGKPEEIASVAAFLCSPAAAYVTGVSVPVDGGRTGAI